MASDAKKIGVQIDNVDVYVTAKGLRLGLKGKVLAPRTFVRLAVDDLAVPGRTRKGVVRTIRRALAKLGRYDLVRASLVS